MSLLSAAIEDNTQKRLPPAYEQNVSQREGSVPVIKGQTDVPVGKAVENPGYTSTPAPAPYVSQYRPVRTTSQAREDIKNNRKGLFRR